MMYFKFNFDFLNIYNNYPNTLFKNNNKKLIYTLNENNENNENNDINVIGIKIPIIRLIQIILMTFL